MKDDPHLTCLSTELRETEQAAIDADWNGHPVAELKERCERLRKRLANGEIYEVGF